MTTNETDRAVIPPRESLMRMAPFALRAEDGDGGDGLTLDGYAAVFNRVTIIDSWEGRFKEQITPGAMKKSFREKPPVIQFDHGRHPMVGSIPIASVRTIQEDVDPVLAPDGGAHIIARLHDNWLVQPVRDAIASNSIDGMSFRFSVVREEWFEANGKRINDEEKLRDLLRRSWYEEVPDEELLLRSLRELKVPELGPVVFPAYADTSVSVRSKVTIDLGRLHDPDQRSILARAVLLADAAEAESEDSETPPTTDDRSADVHVDEPNDTPQTTSDEAGEHESQERRDRIRMMRDQARDTVLTIKTLKEN
jgi:phage head maturation protease